MQWLFFLALFTVASGAASDDLSQALSSSPSEEVFMNNLRERGLLQGQENACQEGVIDGSILGKILEQGYFKTAIDLSQACVENGVKVDYEVHTAVNSIRRKLTEVTSILQQAKLQSASSTIVAPAFEWAQSRDQVFLGVKFAHKLDAPACIDLADEKITIEKQRISLHATCKGKHKTFELNLDLLDEIDPEKSSWSMASVGRGTFTLFKAETDVRWHRLLASATDKPRNMHTWWQLTEKYAKELEEIEKAKTKTSPEADVTSDDVALGEAPGASAGVEIDPIESAREGKRAELQKRAKKDNKRVSKEAKKATKAVDTQLKARLKELDDQHTKDRKSAENSAKKEKDDIQKTKMERLAQIEKTLEEALAKLDSGEDSADANDTSGGIIALYEKMSNMLFGNVDSSNTVPEAEGENPTSTSPEGALESDNKEL